MNEGAHRFESMMSLLMCDWSFLITLLIFRLWTFAGTVLTTEYLKIGALKDAPTGLCCYRSAISTSWSASGVAAVLHRSSKHPAAIGAVSGPVDAAFSAVHSPACPLVASLECASFVLPPDTLSPVLLVHTHVEEGGGRSKKVVCVD